MSPRLATSGPSVAAAGLGLAATAVVGADNGGYFPHSWTTATLLLACLGAIPVVLRGALRNRRAGYGAAALLGAFLLWELASSTWGVAGTEAVAEARRTLIYVVGLLALVAVVEARAVPALLAGALAGIVGLEAYGVAYRFAAATPDTYEGRAVFEPTGYANAQGILATMGILLAIGFVVRGREPRARALAVTGALFLLAALALTESRGAWLALAAAAVLLLAQVRLRYAVALALVAVGVLLVHPVSLDDRSAYWHAAADDVRAHPLLGSGAGSFAAVWARESGQARGPRAFLPAQDAHNLYLETLAETGPLGLALLVAALGLPLAVVRSGRHAPPNAFAAAAYGAFLVHAALDWDWEMPVVTLTALVCASALVCGSALALESDRADVVESPSRPST